MLIIPAFLESYRSLKDKSLKLVYETNEPSPEQFTNIAQSVQKAGFLCFNVDPFTNEDTQSIKSLKADFHETGKSEGQRLRGTLYRNWEINNEGYRLFADFYKAKMEIIINHWKSNLP